MKLTRKERVERIRAQVHVERTVDTARARLITESYRDTEGMAAPLRWQAIRENGPGRG